MIQLMPTTQCAICAFAIPGLKIKTCTLCEMAFHEVCYFQNRSRSCLDCQACTHVMEQKKGKKQKIQPICFICNLSDGLLKEISPNKFSHILCVLTSKNMEIESYKQFIVTQKQHAPTSSCNECKIKSSHLIQCQLCSYRAHISCLPSEQEYVGQNLYENLKLNNLIEIALSCQAEHQTIQLILKCRPQWKNHNKLFSKLAVCNKEFKKYSWCFCGNASLNDQEKNPSILCDGCNRYVHLSCTGMKDPEQIKSYHCPGCKMGDKYRRYAKLPDLILQIIRLQQASFKLSDIRTIDSFPYTLSKKVIQNLKKQKQKLIDYLAIKAINEMANPKNKDENINKQLFYDLAKEIIGEKSKSKSHQEVWKLYCQMLNRLDPGNSIAISLLKPPQSELNQQQNKANLLSEHLQQQLNKLKDLFQQNVVTQIPNIIQYVCSIRRLIYRSNQVKTLIRQNMGKNILFAFILFWCSSKNEQQILQILMGNILKKNNISVKQLEQLKTLKRRGCPNFQNDPAWQIIQNSLQIGEPNLISNSIYEVEQSKIENNPYNSDVISSDFIISKAIQSRQFNPKLYGILKKKISNSSNQTQNKRFKVFYQWSLLSKKIYFGLQKKKMSIAGISHAYKQMKKSKYPTNQMKKKMELLYDYVKPIIKLIRKIENKKIQRPNDNSDTQFYDMLCKPSLQEIKECICKIKQSKYGQVWGDLQKCQLEDQIQKYTSLQRRVKSIIQINQDKFQTKNLQPKEYSTDFAQIQRVNHIQNPHEVLELKKIIKQSNVNFVKISQFYQILSLASSAQTLLKITKWQDQKSSQLNNEKQLIIDLQLIIKELNKRNEFTSFTLIDVLTNSQFQKQVLEKLDQNDKNKSVYFAKHIKRNKKWLEDLKYLNNGVLKSMTYEDICYLQYKVKTSIFDLSKFIQQVILPIKVKCLDVRQSLQQIIPYCQELTHNIVMKQNLYNPQNKFYKSVKQLTVKDFVLKLYQKDCETLKNLMSLQQKLSKKTKQQLKLLIQQFEDVYKGITPFLHEIKTVWDLIMKIFEKILELYKLLKSELEKDEKLLIMEKYKRLFKFLERYADLTQNNDKKSKISAIQNIINQEQKEA